MKSTGRGTSTEGGIPQSGKIEFRGIQGEEMDWQDDRGGNRDSGRKGSGKMGIGGGLVAGLRSERGEFWPWGGESVGRDFVQEGGNVEGICTDGGRGGAEGKEDDRRGMAVLRSRDGGGVSGGGGRKAARRYS